MGKLTIQLKPKSNLPGRNHNSRTGLVYIRQDFTAYAVVRDWRNCA